MKDLVLYYRGCRFKQFPNPFGGKLSVISVVTLEAVFS
ncbi:unnamed protein product [Larinioides sclopetarius]|uniref:Uncharacterized protein n=1 Tax=Larinioides sclopetarius TaxID=280406 RepID=A0AAV2AI28_9ARAC